MSDKAARPDYLSVVRNAIAYRHEQEAEKEGSVLQHGGGGGTSDGMEPRVTRLEEWSKVADERMGRIETKLDSLLTRLSSIPTRAEAQQTLWAALGVAVALLSLLIAGLAYMKDVADRPAPAAQPIIIQVPAVAPAPVALTPAPAPAPAASEAPK